MSGTPVGVGSFGFIAHFCSKPKKRGLLELGRSSQLRGKEEKKAHSRSVFLRVKLPYQALSKPLVEWSGQRVLGSVPPVSHWDDFKQHAQPLVSWG